MSKVFNNYDIDKINNLEKKKILVIGDIILDRYIIGEVNRISPEAPIQIVKSSRKKEVLGGAANVANNITNLGSKVDLLGVIGENEDAEIVMQLLKHVNIDDNLIRTNRKTTVKTRIMSKNQQLLRIDDEEDIDIDIRCENKLIEIVMKKVEEGLDCVVISDYAKGVCTKRVCIETITICIKNGVDVLVDPKGKEWTKYAGATIIKPNLNELACIESKKIKNVDREIEKYGIEILQKYKFKNVLITRAEKGMTLVRDTNDVINIQSNAKEVYDVSGAGDTVIATLATTMANKFKIDKAIRIANISAEIAIGKVGTYSVNIEEISKKIIEENRTYDNYDNRLLDIEEMDDYVKELRKDKKTIVFTNGCFDIVHLGHLQYLKQAKKLGDILIVGLNSDNSVKCLKGNNRPINSELDRAQFLLELEFIDAVIIFEEKSPENLIEKIRPNILVKGGDYKVEDIVGREFAEKTIVLPYKNGYSTTNIVNFIERRSNG